MSVRDKITIGNLEISFRHRNTTSCVVLLHGRLNNIHIKDWVILFQHNSFPISDFYEVENIQQQKSLFEHTRIQEMV